MCALLLGILVSWLSLIIIGKEVLWAYCWILWWLLVVSGDWLDPLPTQLWILWEDVKGNRACFGNVTRSACCGSSRTARRSVFRLLRASANVGIAGPAPGDDTLSPHALGAITVPSALVSFGFKTFLHWYFLTHLPFFACFVRMFVCRHFIPFEFWIFSYPRGEDTTFIKCS